MTTVSKKVGGPLGLAAITALGGYVALRPIEASIKAAVKKERRVIRNHKHLTSYYTVHKAAIDRQGVAFKIGDQFRVLESDGNAVLVELFGHGRNPFLSPVHFCKQYLITKQ